MAEAKRILIFRKVFFNTTKFMWKPILSLANILIFSVRFKKSNFLISCNFRNKAQGLFKDFPHILVNLDMPDTPNQKFGLISPPRGSQSVCKKSTLFIDYFWRYYRLGKTSQWSIHNSGHIIQDILLIKEFCNWLALRKKIASFWFYPRN